MRFRLLLLVSLLAPFNELFAADAPPPSKPNIVFIMADDLGWADVAFHGGHAPSPNLDRLAREGLEQRLCGGYRRWVGRRHRWT